MSICSSPGVNRNILYHNLGNGKFEDVTAKAGIKSDQWAVAAGWFDYDNDGKLDLLVVHYAKWPPPTTGFAATNRAASGFTAIRNTSRGCPQRCIAIAATAPSKMCRSSAGIARYAGRGMSVAFADYDRRRLSGRLRHQRQHAEFPVPQSRQRNLRRDRAAGRRRACAITASRSPAWAPIFSDYDNDGLPDIAVTALAGETFPLFRNLGKGVFTDATYASKLAPLSHAATAAGELGLFDFNNDGWKDLFTANSHVNDRVELFESARYKEPNGVYLNLGANPGRRIRSGQFRDVSAAAGQVTARAHRGSAFADLNGDGRIDVVVSCLGEPAEVWQNLGPAGNWIILKLEGVRSNRDGIGARIRIGDQYNQMTSAVSYASSSHAGVHFGLGKLARIPKIEIRWPSGVVQVLEDVKVNQVLSVREK